MLTTILQRHTEGRTTATAEDVYILRTTSGNIYTAYFNGREYSKTYCFWEPEEAMQDFLGMINNLAEKTLC